MSNVVTQGTTRSLSRPQARSCGPAAAAWLCLACLSQAQEPGGSARILREEAQQPSVVIWPLENRTQAERLDGGVRSILAAALRARGAVVFAPERDDVPHSAGQYHSPKAYIVPGPGGQWDLAGVSVYPQVNGQRRPRRTRPRRACDYRVTGCISQFAASFHVAVTLAKRGREAALATEQATAPTEEGLIDAARSLAERVAQPLAARGAKGRITEAVSRYRARQTTYAVTVATLKAHVADDPFLANMHLLSLYSERRESAPETAEVGQACIAAFDPQEPEHAELMMTLGVDPFVTTADALLSQRQYAQAGQMARRGLQVSGHHRAALAVRVGLALRGEGDTAAAMPCFAGVLKLDPTNTEAILNLAELYEKSGRQDQAAKLYERFLRLPGQAQRKAAVEQHLRRLRGALAPGSSGAP